MEILCECGHKSKEHDDEGCMYWHTLAECNCDLSREIVEARYWAKYYYKKYNTTDHIRADLLKQYWTLAGEYITTKKELDALVARWNNSVSKVYDDKNDLERQVKQLNDVLGNTAKFRDYLLGNMEEATEIICNLLVDAPHISKKNFKKANNFIKRVG